MKLLSTIAIAFIISSCSQGKLYKPSLSNPARSIVKIQALSTGGKQNLGSGVVIATDIVATNCHVVRNAKRAFIIIPEGLYPILSMSTLHELDVCLLKSMPLNMPISELADSEAVQVGDEIIESGHPLALSRSTAKGKVIALHPFRDDRIIEINTSFNHGASGGGVFDQEGKLIGLMTFMGKEHGAMHFYVIPATWLAMGLEQDFTPLKSFKERSFWEKGEFIKEMQK